jgi:hypothetical protein
MEQKLYIYEQFSSFVEDLKQFQNTRFIEG